MVNEAGTDPAETTEQDRRSGRIYRLPDEGPIGGVCAGVARHYNLDVSLVRIGTVILAVIGPGILAYIAAWIFLPAVESSTLAPDPDAPRVDRGLQAFGIFLIIVALSVIWGDWWLLQRGWFFPLGLIALGAWLLIRPSAGSTPPPPPVPPAPPVPPVPPVPRAAPGAPAAMGTGPTAEPTVTTEAPAGESTDDPSDSEPTTEALLADTTGAGAGGEPPGGGVDPEGTDGSTPPSPPVPVAATQRRRRVLGPLVFGILLLWSGIGWLAGVDARTVLAVGLCLVGAGFVVGAFVGGTKALIVPAVLLAVLLGALSIVDIPLSGGVGERTWSVNSVADLRDQYELAIGEGTLDLRNLGLRPNQSVQIDAHVGIGHLVVIVPDGVAVDLEANVAAGEVQVLGETEDGLGVDFERRFSGGLGRGELELDLQVGLGQIEVQRAPAPILLDR